MAGILEGLKIVSMEHMEAIPAASVWLADWGAEVIKVEPLTGDMWRGTRRVRGTSTSVQLAGGSLQFAFEILNRNKKSLALDLKQEPGKEIAYKLIKGTDIFMSNYEASSLTKLKMDYATLSKINPKLIYVFISGYGRVGPLKDEGGYDRVAAWARAGFQYMLGEPGETPPMQRGGMMDRTIAPHAVAGVLAALWHREKTGEGQELEISLYHSAVWTLALDIEAAVIGRPMTKTARTKQQNPIWNFYRTKDDRWITLGMLQSDRYWSNFCKVIGKPELDKDPRFVDMNARMENCVELIRILDELFATKTIEEWENTLKGYDFIYSRVQSPEEVVADPQARVNNFFVDLHHPAGNIMTIATPVKFIQNPAEVRTSAPEVGQHNEEILLELGYSWEDIARLKEQRVIL
jgi:crotonobetainyl-CoA:carnitine CoA-transferase CaiB-like acyl-CoA transferase